ncbi:MAG: hypothetical protein ACYC42_08790 [Lysobacter sp.]
MHPSRRAVIVLASLLLAACGGDKSATGRGTVDGVADEQLPIPAGAPGSAVTGMPDAPGPGQVGAGQAAPLVAGEPVAVALDENGNPLPVDGVPVDPATLPPPPSADPAYPIADDEPTAQDAVAAVRDYYAAINARNYAQAFALWSDGGRATGQSPQQFADGFARTNGVSLEVMAPGRIDAAAGSRYIEVPVALSTTMEDGNQRKYVGMYTLRRAVVEGASPEQRAWRIASADLREVQP